MAITHTVESEAGLLVVKMSGVLTAKDLADFAAAILKDQEAIACCRTLNDVRESEVQFHADELRVISEELFGPAKARGKTWKMAIVVASPMQFGVARQHEMFSSHIKETRVFYHEPEARAWVLAD